MPVQGDFGAVFGAARLGLLTQGEQRIEAVCQPPATDHTIAPAQPQRAGRQDTALSEYLPILAASCLTVRNERRTCRLRLLHLTLAECPFLGSASICVAEG
jgi:hypothetical protein